LNGCITCSHVYHGHKSKIKGFPKMKPTMTKAYLILSLNCGKTKKTKTWSVKDVRKTHNKLSLVLDNKFESLKLIYSFISCEQGVAIIEKYHKRSLFLMFLKCYHHLHLLFEAKFLLLIKMMKIKFCTCLKW
jgi:hypothetical protein